MQFESPISTISFNINGIAPSPATSIKLKYLSQLVRRNHVSIICLQEVHFHSSHPHFNSILNFFPHFTWLSAPIPGPGWGGVAIGIRTSVLGFCPILASWSNDFSSIAVAFSGKLGQSLTAVSSYRNPRHSPNFISALGQLRVRGQAVWGVDMNTPPHSDLFLSAAQWLESIGSSLPVPECPTHTSGSTIDYVGFPVTWASTSIVVCPPIMGDHSPVLLLARRRPKDKGHFIQRVPHTIFKGESFGERLQWPEGISLPSLLSSAKALADRIITETPPAVVVNLVELLVNLLKSRKWNLPLLILNPLFRRASSGLLGPDLLPLGSRRKFRLSVIRCISMRIKDLSSHSNSPPISFYMDSPVLPCIGNRSLPLMVLDPSNNVLVSSPRRTREILESFWTPVFSTPRPYSKIALSSLLRHVYPSSGPIHSTCFRFDASRLKKVFKSLGSSASGPDGVSFSFFKRFRKRLKPLFRDLLGRITSPDFRDPHFCDAYISLIPKADGPAPPSGFRPITVTNAVYRIVGKYLTVDFVNFIMTTISEHQHAILPGRSIANYLVFIRDRFLTMTQSSSPVGLLQTDFAKAYDYLNREAIIAMLVYLHAPPFLVNYIQTILKPSRAYIVCPGTKPQWFRVVTGVRQGCPISPFLFIFVYDTFLRLIAPSPRVITIGGYMDDCSILFSNPDFLNSFTQDVTWYEKAFGGSFSFPKCKVLCHLMSPVTPWAQTCVTSETQILGVPTGAGLSLLETWSPTLQSCYNTARRISHFRLPLSRHILLINTFLISKLSYLSRFVFLSQEIAARLAVIIRIALGTHNSIPSSLLYSVRPPFRMPRPLRHPVLQSFSLAASLPPRLFLPQPCLMPTSTGYARTIGTLEVSAVLPLSDSFPEFFTSQASFDRISESLSSPLSRILYSHLLAAMPPYSPISRMDPHSLAMTHANLFHPFDDHLKVTFMRFLSHSWHFHVIKRPCPWCETEPIDYSHLHTCSYLVEVFNSPAESRILSSHLFLPLNHNTIRLSFHPPDFRTSSIIVNFLHLVRSFLLNHVYGSPNLARAMFKRQWLRVAGNLNLPSGSLYGLASASPIGNLGGLSFPSRAPIPSTFLFSARPRPLTTVGSFSPPPGQYSIFFDGSARTCPPLGGSGVIIYDPNGFCHGHSATLPFCTSNQAEGYALLLGLALVFPFASSLRTPVNVIGDSKLILSASSSAGSLSDPILGIAIGCIRWMCTLIPNISFFKIPRSANQRADAVAFAASVDRSWGFSIASSLPTSRPSSSTFPFPHPHSFSLSPRRLSSAHPSSFFSFPSAILSGRTYPPNSPYGVDISTQPPSLLRPILLPSSLRSIPTSITIPIASSRNHGEIFLSHLPPVISSGFPYGS